MSKFIKITMLFLLILCLFSVMIIGINKVYFKCKQEKIEISIKEKIENNEIEENPTKPITIKDGEIGLIIIPSISVEAPILEGTSNEVLKYAVGHFTETGLWNGNVALASHNGGSYAHNFSRINELENGEEIIYITNMGERRYKITENKIIDETNVDILKGTQENIITLITCVTGKRDKRQCIIGKEIK